MMFKPMLLLKHCLQGFLLSTAIIAASISTISAAETDKDSHKSINEPAKPQAQTGLSVGQSAGDNLTFKPTSAYEEKQNIEAIKKLESIREMHLGSNQWLQVAQVLQDVLATDAGMDIKKDIKRLALLELAGISEDQGQIAQAQQFLAEYLHRFPLDPVIPEVLLRQAYLYRKMEAYGTAIEKLYSVLTAALRIRANNLSYYQRVVLTAQTEIAETFYSQGKYDEAADLYARLLNDPSDELNIEVVKAKLIRSLSKCEKSEDLLTKHAVEFLNNYANSEHQAEVRYLLATTYRTLGQKQESLRQLLLLLEAVEVADEKVAVKWKGWKMLAGNEIGNQLFLEGDFVNAVRIYKGLVNLDELISWKLPLLYQIGLCFERLMQPEEASKSYQEILQLSQKDQPALESNLQMVVEMAKLRHDVLSWRKNLNTPDLPAEQKVAEKPTP